MNRLARETILEAARLYLTGLSTYETGRQFAPPIHHMTLAFHFQKMGIMRSLADSNRTARSRYLRSINKANRHQGKNSPEWKGDKAGQQAGRMRARKLYPDPPEVCTLCQQKPRKRMDRHHRDGNPLNNSPDNVTWLCSLCHNRQHPKKRRADGRLLPDAK